MKQKLRLLLPMLMSLAVIFATCVLEVKAATTITSNQTGTNGGYNYELWKDNGTTSMTLKDGGAFSCSWSNINNALFRKGKKFNETQTHQQIGNISVKYACDYQSSGNSYLCVYGWTSNPLVEYYIVDSWGTWRPPGSTSKGTITVDGGTYDVYETTRTNQPSIKGNTTFKQYWSVRTSKKTSGTISVSEHFKAWESKGMKLGKMYEVALTVEGYQSSGKADVTSMSINIGDTNTKETDKKDTNTNAGNVVKDNTKEESKSTTDNTKNSTRSAFKTIEAEKYDKTNSSSIKVSGNGKGGKAISYIKSGNTVTYKNIDFGQGVSSMSATIAAKEKTKIEVREGTEKGSLLGTLTSTSTGDWNTYKKQTTTIKNVTGVKDVVLVFSGPVNMDSFEFTAASKATPTGNTKETSNSKSNDNSGNWWSNWSWFTNLFAKKPSKTETVTEEKSATPTPTTTTGKKYIALTFDDGPNTTTTPLVLDKLKKNNVVASFFLCGKDISNSTKAVMERQISQGCEINSHGYSHSDMSSMSASQIKEEMKKTSDAIENMVGVRPKFFRPPYIATSNTMYQAIDLPFVNGINCNDWTDSVASGTRAKTIVKNAKDGDIVLLHDFNGNTKTVDALDEMIKGLKEKGFTFVTVSELFKIKGVDPNVENKIWTNVSK